MAFGSIYTTTNFGNGVCDNAIDWGIIYRNIANCTPLVFDNLIAENGDNLIDEIGNNLISN
tara:strand:- start:2545 stop:2727 length:183 start_codon:yes stop_codon:yes gene_type:complete